LIASQSSGAPTGTDSCPKDGGYFKSTFTPGRHFDRSIFINWIQEDDDHPRASESRLRGMAG
jgi:hypothetical protein